MRRRRCRRKQRLKSEAPAEPPTPERTADATVPRRLVGAGAVNPAEVRSAKAPIGSRPRSRRRLLRRRCP
eukprot:8230411-Pyramimonas_sp.AAC.1